MLIKKKKYMLNEKTQEILESDENSSLKEKYVSRKKGKNTI